MTPPIKPKRRHVKRVAVRFCDNGNCDGDEEGCNGTECRNPKWQTIADSVLRVYRNPSQSAKWKHPATFPVELCTQIYNSYAKAGDIVYEPFCGSGTSLIACEKFNAVCYGVEIDPAYCDVTVRRWQEFTGKKAKLEKSGQTFDKVEAVKP